MHFTLVPLWHQKALRAEFTENCGVKGTSLCLMAPGPSPRDHVLRVSNTQALHDAERLGVLCDTRMNAPARLQPWDKDPVQRNDQTRNQEARGEGLGRWSGRSDCKLFAPHLVLPHFNSHTLYQLTLPLGDCLPHVSPFQVN